VYVCVCVDVDAAPLPSLPFPACCFAAAAAALPAASAVLPACPGGDWSVRCLPSRSRLGRPKCLLAKGLLAPEMAGPCAACPGGPCSPVSTRRLPIELCETPGPSSHGQPTGPCLEVGGYMNGGVRLPDWRGRALLGRKLCGGWKTGSSSLPPAAGSAGAGCCSLVSSFRLPHRTLREQTPHPPVSGLRARAPRSVGS
jgi:hypothetical protein